MLHRMPSIADMVDYDLTMCAGEILEVINGKGFLGVTTAQRRRIDRIVSKYAARATKIVLDHAN
jgi:hypothetical protein